MPHNITKFDKHSQNVTYVVYLNNKFVPYYMYGYNYLLLNENE